MSTSSSGYGANDAAVETGPAVTDEQQRAIREAEADEAERRVAKLEAKAEQIKEALKDARAEAKRLRLRVEGGGE